jgi:histidine triad (HIT) family protein
MSPEEIAEAQKQNCIFCKIIDGDVPSKTVYEDERMLAILDIRPSTEGHVLVMPKEHYPILPVVPEEEFNHVFGKAKKIAAAVKHGVPATGTTIYVANGAAAGQQSPHFLFHIIPRDQTDGMFLVDKNDIDQSQLLQPLQQNVGKAMQKKLAEQGKLPNQGNETAHVQLTQVLEENPDLREAIKNDPDEVAKIITSNPQLQRLFDGVDLHKLSQKLRDLDNDTTDVSLSEDTKHGSEPPSDEADDQADLDKVSRLFK